MMEQVQFLLSELKVLVHGRHWRWLSIWFGSSAWVNISYRLDRSFYLLFGRSYPAIRPFFYPLFLLCSLLGGRHEIHYRAQIGQGFRVLHAALGTVISGKTVAGERLILVGGNLIGGRKPLKPGEIAIGHDVTLGANAVVLGPVIVGDNAQIGAGAVVVSNVPPGAVFVGIPARELRG